TSVGPELTASVTAVQSSASGIRTVSGDPTTAWSCSVRAADPRATRTAPSAGTSTLESVKTDCTTPLRSRRGVAGGNGPRTTIVPCVEGVFAPQTGVNSAVVLARAGSFNCEMLCQVGSAPCHRPYHGTRST